MMINADGFEVELTFVNKPLFFHWMWLKNMDV